MFQHNGNNLSALWWNYFLDRWEFVDELAQSRRNSVFLHCSWPLVQPCRPSQTLSLPTLVDGWSPNGHDVVIPFSLVMDSACCVCNTCSSLAVILEWACTPAYQPVVLFLSVTLYLVSTICTTKSKLCIKDITMWAAGRWQSLDFTPAVCPKDLHISVCILFLEVLCIFLFVVERI